MESFIAFVVGTGGIDDESVVVVAFVVVWLGGEGDVVVCASNSDIVSCGFDVFSTAF